MLTSPCTDKSSAKYADAPTVKLSCTSKLALRSVKTLISSSVEFASKTLPVEPTTKPVVVSLICKPSSEVTLSAGSTVNLVVALEFFTVKVEFVAPPITVSTSNVALAAELRVILSVPEPFLIVMLQSPGASPIINASGMLKVTLPLPEETAI